MGSIFGMIPKPAVQRSIDPATEAGKIPAKAENMP
jgi:hypothetical protein